MVDEKDAEGIEEEVISSEVEDELDDWFNDEEDEDLSAEEDEEEPEESSDDGETEEPEPDEEVQSDDAGEASEDGNSTNSESTEDDPVDWVAALDPAAKEQVEKLTQSERSQRGRVAALQRQLDSVRSQQEARERTHPAPAANVAAGTGKQVEDMDDEELAEFMEEFPSVASNVQKLIDRKVQAEIAQRIQPIEEASLQRELETNRQELRQEATRIFNTVETGIELDDVLASRAFHEWVAMQPQEYQDFASRAQSVPAAAKVLEDFAIYTEEQVSAIAATQQERAADETNQEKSRSADSTANRRRQAREAPTPRSRSAQVRTKGNSGSYEDDFNYFADGGG